MKTAAKLRAARDRMNSGGKHWIKGEEHMLVTADHDPGGRGEKYPVRGRTPRGFAHAYCSIGALKAERADDLAVIALAEVIEPSFMAHARKDAEEYAKDCEFSVAATETYVHQCLREQAEETIVKFNDDSFTTWAEVHSAFTRAAKRIADRARRSA